MEPHRDLYSIVNTQINYINTSKYEIFVCRKETPGNFLIASFQNNLSVADYWRRSIFCSKLCHLLNDKMKLCIETSLLQISMTTLLLLTYDNTCDVKRVNIAGKGAPYHAN